jgi:hypothetical protein
MGPHIPMQCPKPTMNPVVKKVRYKASIDDIENKLHKTLVRDSNPCSPNSFSAGASYNGAGSGIDAFSMGFENHPVGTHFHSRHVKINEASAYRGRGGHRSFPGLSDPLPRGRELQPQEK